MDRYEFMDVISGIGWMTTGGGEKRVLEEAYREESV
jgi:hypothetical protein